MSTKITTKISKFFLIAAAVAAVLTIVVVFVVRGIFASLNLASDVDQKALENQGARINKINLDKAHTFVTQRQFTPLDLR